jgi:hypothetical protein
MRRRAAKRTQPKEQPTMGSLESHTEAANAGLVQVYIDHGIMPAGNPELWVWLTLNYNAQMWATLV